MTMGIVVVDFCAARVAVVFSATIRSTFSFTSSSA